MTEQQQAWPAPQYSPHAPLPEPVVRKPRRIGLTIGAAVAAIAIAGGSAVAGGLVALDLHPAAAATIATATSTGSSGTTAETTSLASVAASVLPSVVSIQTESA